MKTGTIPPDCPTFEDCTMLHPMSEDEVSATQNSAAIPHEEVPMKLAGRPCLAQENFVVAEPPPLEPSAMQRPAAMQD